MRVPINPTTNAPAGELGYEKPVDVTAGTRALASVVDKFAEYADKEQKQRELFDVQKQIVDETNNLQTDFDARKTAAPLGAPDFVKTLNTDYAARHAQMVSDLQSKGYSKNAVNEFANRLGTIRSQYVGLAIDFQSKSSYAKVNGDADQMAISLSQYASKNPNAIDSALNEFHTALQNSGLDAIEQEALFQSKKGEIIRGAQDGFVMQHPDAIVQLYDPQHFVLHTANSPDGTATAIATQPVKPDGSLADNIVAGLKNRGLTDYQARGIAAGIAAESANKTDARNNEGGGHGAFGLGQWRADRQAALFAKYGPNPTGAQQLDFLVSELRGGDAGGKAVLAQADEVSVLHSYIHDFMRPSDAGAKGDISRGLAALGRKVAEHADLTATQLKQPVPGRSYNVEDAIQELGMTADQAQQFVATGKDPRPQAQQIGTALQSPTISMDEQGKTGIAVLDNATGEERLQMLTRARVLLNEQVADQKAMQHQQHETWLNEFYNGLQDGKLTQADLNSALASRQITDFDERKKAQTILDDLSKKNDDLANFHLMLQAGTKFNPYDNKAQSAVDAGFVQAVKISEQNNMNVSPVEIALRAWQRTGILPKQGAVMLRGGLIGTDPKQVAASASVASNMLKENPNAFAGVEGGQEIGLAAATYAHYVDDLGMNADQAAQKIALQNSPEFQAKIKVNEPERNAFISSIAGTNGANPKPGIDIEKVINDSIYGPRGWGSTLTFHSFDPVRGTFTEPQKAEARQTYLELALDHYDKYHDPAAAQAYATQQMSRFYGIEGNRMLKYPATKAYPEIMGSRDYIFDQAKGFVDKAAGFAIPKEDIFLQPTASGSTAAAFRAGQPAPYEIHYLTHENGQSVYHYIPGKVFVADVNEAKQAAAQKAKAYEAEIRSREQAIRSLAGQSFAH